MLVMVGRGDCGGGADEGCERLSATVAQPPREVGEGEPFVAVRSPGVSLTPGATALQPPSGVG